MKNDLFQELLASLKEAKQIQAGKKKAARVTRFRVLDPKATRAKSGLSQERFAALIGVKVTTYRNWEQKRRVPHGPAQVLLMVADYDSSIIRKAIRAQWEEPQAIPMTDYGQAELRLGTSMVVSRPELGPLDWWSGPRDLNLCTMH